MEPGERISMKNLELRGKNGTNQDSTFPSISIQADPETKINLEHNLKTVDDLNAMCHALKRPHKQEGLGKLSNKK